MMNDVKQIEMDRMRYTKNTLSANLVLAGILFNVFYFVSLYRSDVQSYYYNILIGASIIYNLIFMLAAFLCSEGVKSRKPGIFPVVLSVLGLIQVGRIFILPMQAHSAMVKVGGAEQLVMSDGQFYGIVCYLIASAVCCVAAGVTSYMQNKKLTTYLNTMAQTKS